MFHTLHRWWRQFWDTEDPYVKGVRLGTRSALKLKDYEIIDQIRDLVLFNKDDFYRGWIEGCKSVLIIQRGWTSELVQYKIGAANDYFS